jgi:hypothetical protein
MEAYLAIFADVRCGFQSQAKVFVLNLRNRCCRRLGEKARHADTANRRPSQSGGSGRWGCGRVSGLRDRIARAHLEGRHLVIIRTQLNIIEATCVA